MNQDEWRKKASLCLAGLLFVLFCTALLLMIRAAVNDRDGEWQETSGTVAGSQDYWTFAVFALDPGKVSGGDGTRLDEIFLCTIEKASGGIRLVSISGDTEFYGEGEPHERSRIRSIYEEEGVEGTVSVLHDNLNLVIGNDLVFQWQTAEKTVDLLGGIDMELADQIGLSHLDGARTVAYCRQGLADSGQERSKRQGEAAAFVLDKLKSADILTQKQVIDVVLSEVKRHVTDQDISSLMFDIPRLHVVGEKTFPLESGEKDPDSYGVSEQDLKELYRFLYQQEMSGSVDQAVTTTKK